MHCKGTCLRDIASPQTVRKELVRPGALSEGSVGAAWKILTEGEEDSGDSSEDEW